MEAARHAAGRLRLLRRGSGTAVSYRSRSSRACRQVTYSGQRERQPNKNNSTSKKDLTYISFKNILKVLNTIFVKCYAVLIEFKPHK
jgi:hypothetical protein